MKSLFAVRFLSRRLRPALGRPAFWLAVALSLSWGGVPMQAADAASQSGIVYREGGISAAERALCQLDLYLPTNPAGAPSLLWLHGGGLTGGTRDSAVTVAIAKRLAASGIIVASAGYRKNPAVTFPAYVEDAAAALAWLQRHVAEHGGDPQRVYIGGHSAGAYLALMVALDARYLTAAGGNPATLAGVVAVSGQTQSHFTVRAERKMSGPGVRVDDAAPLYHVHPMTCGFLLMYAGRDMALRVEENRLLAGALRAAGCQSVRESFFADRDHSTIVGKMAQPEDPVARDILAFMGAR